MKKASHDTPKISSNYRWFVFSGITAGRIYPESNRIRGRGESMYSPFASGSRMVPARWIQCVFLKGSLRFPAPGQAPTSPVRRAEYAGAPAAWPHSVSRTYGKKSQSFSMSSGRSG